MKAGDILLFSPFATLRYCIAKRRWPGLKTLFDCLCGLAVLVICRSQYTHVLQCIDDDQFVHTSLGRVRLQRKRDFPFGYLETVKVVSLEPELYTPRVKSAFEHAVGRLNIDPTTIPLAAPWRWLYRLGLVGKEFRAGYRFVNCATFVARTWKEGGVDLLKRKNMRTCWVGIYPSDFL